MLAGEHAADFDTQSQDVVAELLGRLELPGLIGVVQNQRVQITVARMEYIGHAETIVLRQLSNTLQHLGQSAARDGAIHAVVVRSNAAHGGKGSLAAGPESQPLRLARGTAARLCGVAHRQPLDVPDEVIALGRRAVDFDDE